MPNSGAKQTPGRVNYRTLLSPIVGVADTSPEGGSKEYVILSDSEISHRTIALLVVIAREHSDRGNPLE